MFRKRLSNLVNETRNNPNLFTKNLRRRTSDAIFKKFKRTKQPIKKRPRIPSQINVPNEFVDAAYRDSRGKPLINALETPEERIKKIEKKGKRSVKKLDIYQVATCQSNPMVEPWGREDFTGCREFEK